VSSIGSASEELGESAVAASCPPRLESFGCVFDVSELGSWESPAFDEQPLLMIAASALVLATATVRATVIDLILAICMGARPQKRAV
jgi:hypothetical protein